MPWRSTTSESRVSRRSHEVPLPGHAVAERLRHVGRTGSEAVCRKRSEIDLGIAAGDHVREHTSRRGRVLEAVAAEPVDQEQTVDVLSGPDDRIRVRRYFVQAGPG